MKVKIKKVTTYEYNPISKYEMTRKGEVYINPYVTVISNILEYFTVGETKKDFVLLYQQGKAYYVLLSDIEDIFEIC